MELTVSGLLDAMFPKVYNSVPVIYPLWNTLKDFGGNKPDLAIGLSEFVVKESRVGLKITNPAGVDTTLPMSGISGSTGEGIYTLGCYFYNSEAFTANRWLFSSGDATNSMGLRINVTSNKLEWVVTVSGTTYTATTDNELRTGWNAVLLTRFVEGGSQIVLNGVLTLTENGTYTPVITGNLILGAGSTEELVVRGLYCASEAPYDSGVQNYMADKYPALRLRRGSLERIIDGGWVAEIEKSATDEMFVVTIPPDIIQGYNYTATVQLGSEESALFELIITEIPLRNDGYEWDARKHFAGRLFENFNALKVGDTTAGGGFSPENISVGEGEVLVLAANGDAYAGDIQGYDDQAELKFHSDLSDPNLPDPWTHRVGAGLSMKEYVGFGTWQMDAVLPQKEGVAFSLWLANEDYIREYDPRWAEFIAAGLHYQVVGGRKVIVRKNFKQLDIFVSAGKLAWRCTNMIGEVGTLDSVASSGDEGVRYTGVTDIPASADIRTLKIEWLPGSVKYSIDDTVLLQSSNFAGSVMSDFNFGLWFPSPPLAGAPWLVDPAQGWAGGIIDPDDDGQRADFETEYAQVSRVVYTPAAGEIVKSGENRPFFGESVFTETYYEGPDFEFGFDEGSLGTLLFCMDNDRWRGADLYESDMFFRAGSGLYSFHQGKIWMNNDVQAGFNTFYGIKYPSTLGIASSGKSSKIKAWQTIAVEGTDAPIKTYIKSKNDETSTLEIEDYAEREGVYYAAIRRAGSGAELVTGERLRGDYAMVLLEFNTEEKLQIKAVNVGFRESAGHEQI
ncbi:hypothetical protein GCM10027051_31290 [Niabella terrae]